ncbi:MAG TPA: sigma-70 family RNA polymerase sigma factor [Polyangiales bacterium]|jgi:RNA polymerase sigma-70 factor (ECF subfamily)|nr:sigma-70 family RNA polymerase sigma factor [Polyangiales bacterium]
MSRDRAESLLRDRYLSVTTVPDPELLEGARRGDARALETLLERHAPAVYRFGLKMCGNPHDAQDVVQETLLAAARSLQDFRGDASFTTWLYTVARNACSRRARSSKFAPAALEPLRDDDSLPSHELAPDEALERSTLARTLDEALASLSASEREILVLRDIEGLSASETSEVLGLSVAAVKSRLHRARAALRERLEPHFPAGERLGATQAGASCPEIVSVFSQYLEGEIGPAQCEAMQAHVAGCKRCDAACNSLRRSVALCNTAPVEPVPPEVQARIKEALRGLLPSGPAADAPRR